ncbi:response regulator [Streptomyces cupreus]|uniref:Response regulator transcription factor n=1 Tax=Streptomyces cupreus TaxID=2759956 RepID=A0A7X1J9W5_9ACTN|nr:response regulator transcription factor [Streptomyces cupreus]MBC2904317.1 response regulator transcription factor [Streptomyces cupreus]
MTENPEAESVSVLVVDDQQLVRDGIASLLGIQPGIVLAGTAVDGGDAVEKTLALGPDVVLMDVRMPGIDGVEALAILRRRGCSARVVMLTTFDDEEYVVAALRAGASGYLLKNLPAAQLADAVRLAHAGVAQLDSSVTGYLTPSPASGPRPPSVPPPGTTGLTAREVDVLRLLADGSTNREIAARLFLSEGTVKNHISRVLSRLGLRDRTQAALYARDHGLL